MSKTKLESRVFCSIPFLVIKDAKVCILKECYTNQQRK